MSTNRVSDLDFFGEIFEFEDELAQNRLDHITYSSIAAMQTDETLNPGDTAIINGAIYDTLEVTKVEDETDMTDPDMIYLYNGTYYKGDSGEEAVGFASENGFVVVSNKNTFVTPEMFGAIGDGIADDTIAINNACSDGRPILATKIYRTTGEINMGWRNDFTADFSNSEIHYEGTGSAVVIQGINGGTIDLGYVVADNGNTIEFRSSEGLADRTQYVKLSFKKLSPAPNTGIGIFVNVTDSGWSNQNTVYCGEFARGGTGVKFYENVSSSQFSINGWTFYEPGMEGPLTHYDFNATNHSITGVSIYGARYAERESTTIIKQRGRLIRLFFDGWYDLDLDRLDMDDSEVSRTTIQAPITENNLTIGHIYYKRSRTEPWTIENYIFDVEKNETLNTLTSKGITTGTRNSAVASAGDIFVYRFGNMRTLYINGLTPVTEGDIITSANALPEYCRPPRNTEIILMANDGLSTARAWLRTDGTIAITGTNRTKTYSGVQSYMLYQS